MSSPRTGRARCPLPAKTVRWRGWVGAGLATKRWSVMRQSRRQKEIAAFVAGRSPQTDSDFVADCRIQAIDRAQDIARAVREAVAHSCDVDPGSIRAADGFSQELYLLRGRGQSRLN